MVSKKIGVSDHTYYHWRKEYGGMRVDQARQLKELEQENSRERSWRSVDYLRCFRMVEYNDFTERMAKAYSNLIKQTHKLSSFIFRLH